MIHDPDRGYSNDLDRCFVRMSDIAST